MLQSLSIRVPRTVAASPARAGLCVLCVWWLCGAVQAADPSPRPLPFPSELVEFGPASRVPLFSGGGEQAWDRDLRERGWILREGGQWHLWYTGYNRPANSRRLLGRGSATSSRLTRRAASLLTRAVNLKPTPGRGLSSSRTRPPPSTTARRKESAFSKVFP
jgi:hypothetical protein